jgi:hypothetical protein
MNYSEFKDKVVYKFRLGDVEDPEIYAADPLYQWEQSEQGKWVKEVSLETPTWYIRPCMESMGYQVIVTAKLTDRDQIFFDLKYS